MKLRWFIKENGERVLQQYWAPHDEWEDVPTHKEPEKTVTITEKQLDNAFNAARSILSENFKEGRTNESLQIILSRLLGF